MRNALTELAEVEALPDRTVVVMTNLPNKDDAHWWTETAIYQKFSGKWMEMNPEDRFDGEYSWGNEDILVIAKREGYNVYVAFNPDDFKSEERSQ